MIVSRSELMEKVWKKETDPFSNTIESHIVNLRKKVNLNGSRRNIIISCHGKGYRIDSYKK
jgi:DNA-binding response OmpR family regulator